MTKEARLKGLNTIRLKHQNNENVLRASAYLRNLDRFNLTWAKMAEMLNDNKLVTAQGKQHGSSQVHRILKRLNSQTVSGKSLIIF